MKTIVTHISPDLDAVASSWLIKRYLPGWESADHAFVPAGETLDGMKPDADPDIIHVDTGLGKFDHHQSSERTSATEKVFQYLISQKLIKKKDREAVAEMVQFVTLVDNFGEVDFPDPTDTRYTFCLHEFMYPLRGQLTSDVELVNMIFLVLDSILYTVKNNLKAKEEIREGIVLQTSFGKTILMETQNEAAVKYALKVGYMLVVRKDPENGTVRIKTKPDPTLDLTTLYDVVTKEDPGATWFLHASKNMLLNGSSKNPKSVPSRISVPRLIEILRTI